MGVSIPYRYATNRDKYCYFEKRDKVSIPYRYATNREKEPVADFEVAIVSIPYRYATNHLWKSRARESHSCFNPL